MIDEQQAKSAIRVAEEDVTGEIIGSASLFLRAGRDQRAPRSSHFMLTERGPHI